MKRRLRFSRLLFTDEGVAGSAHRGVVAQVQRAVVLGTLGGCAVVWRAKHRAPAQLLPIGRRVAQACRARGVLFLVHNHIGLVHELSADGLHLSSDRDPARARAQLGPDSVVGQSVHAGDEGRALGPLDYVTVSPVFAPTSKAAAGPVLGLDGLAQFCRAVEVPVIALGGIDSEARHTACLAAGASGTASLGTWLRA